MAEVAPAYNVVLSEVGTAAGMLVAQAVAGTLVAHRIEAVVHKLLTEVGSMFHSSNSALPPATP